MKRSFFQAAVTSILLYGCTTWMLTKRLEKKLDSNYTRMLRAILNKSWRQHPARHQLYGHLPHITKTIQVRHTRHAGHCWRIRDELIRDVLLWTPTYGQAKAWRPARTYIQQLCEDTGCNPEDLPKAMKDREKWRERVRDNVLAARHDDDNDYLLYYLVWPKKQNNSRKLNSLSSVNLRQRKVDTSVCVPKLYDSSSPTSLMSCHLRYHVSSQNNSHSPKDFQIIPKDSLTAWNDVPM